MRAHAAPDEKGLGGLLDQHAEPVGGARARVAPLVTLYVNDYNTRARRLYQGLGFRTVGELATVLY